MSVGKALKSSIADQKIRSPIELVRQPTLAELYLAVHAAVCGVGVDLDHAGILSVGWARPLEDPAGMRSNGPTIRAS
jgi:hypothetical protein